jgi:heterodisulfide reductase subunit A
MGCGACAEVCTYGALEMRDTKQGKKVVINPVLCKGDGLCNAKCPTGAISLKHYTDEEVDAEIDVMVPEEEILQQIDAAAGE